MGEDIADQEFTSQGRARYREKLSDCIRAFDRMLVDMMFDDSPAMFGLEMEFSLVDSAERPNFTNAEVLEAIADPEFQTELGRFNVETNVPPQLLAGRSLTVMEDQLRESLNSAESRAASIGSHLVSVGILPTLAEEHLDDRAISANPRYRLLSEELRRLRGEDFLIEIEGEQHLRMQAGTIIPEAACTSTQIHLQTTPGEFAATWNAAQAVSALQLATGANSPYFVGRRLWAETRVPLFEQAIDARTAEMRLQGALARVWFGKGWIESAQDLFDENLEYFEPILPVLYDDDPLGDMDAGPDPVTAGDESPQRDRLPVEPTGVRRRRRSAPPAHREPVPALRADRGRHDCERGLLPGTRSGPARRGDASVVRSSRSPSRSRTSSPQRGTDRTPSCSGRGSGS